MEKIITLVVCLFLLVYPTQVFAQSDYVLPYPSFMPGSTFYKVGLIKEKIQQYWYFGNFSQYTYNLQLSDKYLVEAKTLFEYKQYLLATNALKKSDNHWQGAIASLEKAGKEQKNIQEKKEQLKSAGEKHQEVLSKIKEEIPESFVWNPEKGGKTDLALQQSIDQSIRIQIYE